MTTTIMVANQKGGVGKTTIADEILFSMERRGKNAVFMSLDQQGGSAHAPCNPLTLTGEEDYVVIDTPGALSKDFSDWCDHADMVIFPTHASYLDLVPLQRCYTIAKQSKAGKLGVVVNQYDGHRTADREFMSFLKNAEYPVWATVPTATAFVKANMMKQSIHDVDAEGRGAKAIERLCDRIEEESHGE